MMVYDNLPDMETLSKEMEWYMVDKEGNVG